jgi:hypothetical protein
LTAERQPVHNVLTMRNDLQTLKIALSLTTLCLSLSACSLIDYLTPSFLQSNTSATSTEATPVASAQPSAIPTPTSTPTTVAVQAFKPAPLKKDDIEILWQVPAESVDGYVIRWGTQREALTSEKKISLSEIQKLKHPDFGEVYRYIIQGVNTPDQLYVTLAAIHGKEISAASEVMVPKDSENADAQGKSH